jgi:hypothetical protein
VQFDGDLQLVINAWDTLPLAVRREIVALVKSIEPKN